MTANELRSYHSVHLSEVSDQLGAPGQGATHTDWVRLSPDRCSQLTGRVVAGSWMIQRAILESRICERYASAHPPPRSCGSRRLVRIKIKTSPPESVFMARWRAFIDESYNSRTFCVGVTLAPTFAWTPIVEEWDRRIDHERRISLKHGFNPISRYHATDCANLKREFSEKHGWNIARQINLTKALCNILGKHVPASIVMGGGIAEVRHYINLDVETPEAFLYSTCFKMCLMDVVQLLGDNYPSDEIEVFFERSDFETYVHEALDLLRGERPEAFNRIVDSQPRGWEDCTELQVADFMAYQGMQRIDASLKGNGDMRKSLRALIGRQIPISIAHFKEENFADLMKMIENKNSGRPIAEGVESGIELCVGKLPYITA